MSEKKKPWSVRAVFGRTLDDVASNLEDQLNKFEEEGVGVSRIDAVTSGEGHGYIVIGREPEPEETPQITVIPLGSPPPDSIVEPLTKKFLNALAENATSGDWDGMEKAALKSLPSIVSSYTSTDIATIAKDIDDRRESHRRNHNDEDCPKYKALTTISKLLKDRLGLHIS